MPLRSDPFRITWSSAWAYRPERAARQRAHAASVERPSAKGVGVAQGSVHPEVLAAVFAAARAELGAAAETLFADINWEERIPMDRAQAAWAGLARLDTDSTLGARMGGHPAFTAGLLKMLGVAAATRGTVGRGMRIVAHYFPLISSSGELSLSLEGAGDERVFVARTLYGAGPRPPVVGQSTMRVLLEAIRASTRVAVPLRQVRLSAPLPRAALTRLQGLYGAPVQAGTGVDALLFDATFVEHAFIPVESERGALFLAQAKEALSRVDTASGFQEDVIKEIQTLLPEAPTVNAIADRLGITARTLQRHLNNENVQFRALARKTRLEIAKSYLEVGGAVSEVAFLVGYSDATTFSRAYRKEMGHPPVTVSKR